MRNEECRLMRSCNSFGNSCGTSELGLGLCSSIEEDRGVFVILEHDDELAIEDDGDWRMNESRRVRAPLIGFSIVVKRNAAFSRRTIGFVAFEGNKAGGTVVEVIEPSLSLWQCAFVDRIRTLLGVSASTGSCIKTNFLFLVAPSRAGIPSSKLELFLRSSLLFPC